MGVGGRGEASEAWRTQRAQLQAISFSQIHDPRSRPKPILKLNLDSSWKYNFWPYSCLCQQKTLAPSQSGFKNIMLIKLTKQECVGNALPGKKQSLGEPDCVDLMIRICTPRVSAAQEVHPAGDSEVPQSGLWPHRLAPKGILYTFRQRADLDFPVIRDFPGH